MSTQTRGELFNLDLLTPGFIPFLERPHLIFADPPFNAGKKYGEGKHNDHMDEETYLCWLERWIAPLSDLLLPGGTFWLMHETEWIGECMHLLRGSGLQQVNLVAWVYTNPTPAGKRYQKTYHPIAVYSKGQPAIWVSDALPMERETLYFNPARREKGKLFVHDVWADVPKLVGGYLAQPELLRKEDKTFAHLAQMPIRLAERAILTATAPGDLVLDPFAGSGTVLKAAEGLGRRWVGVEQEEEYCALIRSRVGE